jgi:oligogalacturonide lyase
MTSRGSNSHTYFTHPVWLPDSTGLVFLSERTGIRESFLLEWPRGKISQITEGGTGSPVVSLGGDTIYHVRDRVLLERKLSGGEEWELARLPEEVKGTGMMGQMSDRKTLVVCCSTGNGSLLAKAPRAGGELEVFHRDSRHLSHLNPSPRDPELLSVAWTRHGGGETSQRLWLARIGGGGLVPLYTQSLGELVTHEAWAGDGRWIVFTSGPFERRPDSFSLKRVSPRDEHSESVAKHGNFWHCSANGDCSQVVADTNWPDVGIKIADTKTSKIQTLCLSRRREAHSHPCFSADGTKVVFTSDMSGRSQVYVAELP